MTDTERERQRHRQREKQTPRREPDMGFNPRSPGSGPGLKVGQTTKPPGLPKEDLLKEDSTSLGSLGGSVV